MPVPTFAGLPELSPEFYKELCDIASEIAQDLKEASGRLASSPGADGTSTYRDVPTPSAATYPAGSDNDNPPAAAAKGKRPRPRAPPKQPPKKRQCTSRPLHADTLPPAVDTSTQPETPEKPFGCPFVTHTSPCLQRFSRETDIKRHVRGKHLGVGVFCTHAIHGPGGVPIVRHDGVFRHLAFNTCMGRAALDELVAQRGRDMTGASDAGSRKWQRRVERAVGRDHTAFVLPCYHLRAFWEAIAHLPGWTPHRLEQWCWTYGDIERCGCERCREISDAQLRGEVKVQMWDQEGNNPRSATASGVAGPSSSGTVAPAAGPSAGPTDMAAAIADDAEWDDRLPPEEEEGVDEDPPQVTPAPPVADTVTAVAEDSGTIATVDVASVPPELQAIYDILSGLSAADLESLLHGPDGSVPDVDSIPDGKADA